MKQCFHRKVDFKTNALNNAHVLQLLHYKAGLLQNDDYYKLADQNKLTANGYKSHLAKCPKYFSINLDAGLLGFPRFL
jgi:hypothetical protein